MTIGPGAREKEVSAAAASTGASVPPPDRRRPPHRRIVAGAAQDRDGAVWCRHRRRARLACMLDDLLRLLVPAVCVGCRAARAVGRADPLCQGCRLALPWLAGHARCGRCGLPEPHAPRACPARRQAFAAAWAPLAYAGPVPALVKGLKERGAVGLARTMA